MVVLTAIYHINRTPSRVLQGKVPLHLLQPNGTLFPLLPCVFGCTCFVQNRSPTGTKLDDKTVPFFSGTSTLLGYAVETSVEDSSLLPRLVPIFKPSLPSSNSSSIRSLPLTTTVKPVQVYS
ncbi:hypothetical protein QYF36_024711 [Acer negundo]|nr:hypothetical protein QYF36_024711 [Acer negundo]